jgi:hypothetical protein
MKNELNTQLYNAVAVRYDACIKPLHADVFHLPASNVIAPYFLEAGNEATVLIAIWPEEGEKRVDYRKSEKLIIKRKAPALLSTILPKNPMFRVTVNIHTPRDIAK